VRFGDMFNRRVDMSKSLFMGGGLIKGGNG